MQNTRMCLSTSFCQPLKGQLLARLTVGIRVCNLGCGHGVAMNLRASSFPKSAFVGIANHEDAVGKAAEAAQETGIGKAQFTRCLMLQQSTGKKSFSGSLLISVTLMPSTIKAILWKY